MTVLSKILYYFSRTIHVILLPILYAATLWYPTGRWWEKIGLIPLFILPFYPIIIKSDEEILFRIRVTSYIIIIGIFFPANFFSDEYGVDYRVIVFFDMCFLFFVDLWIYRQNKSKTPN